LPFIFLFGGILASEI